MSSKPWNYCRRLPQARKDATRLKGATFVDASWTLFEWLIRFDCELTLRVWIEKTEIQWTLVQSTDLVLGEEFQHVGATPVLLDWVGTVGLWAMDCSSLVAKRRGSRFKDLFVNESGLFVYLHNHLILEFGRAERLADCRTILFVCEDD